MSKKKSQKTPRKTSVSKSKGKRSNARLYILVGILLLVMAGWIFMPKAPVPGNNISTPSSKVTPKSKSKRKNTNFEKEGSLTFLRPSGEEIKTIDIEVSDDDEERGQGLMHRQQMSDGQGMLFIFEKPEIQSFWMKNTYLALDIIYIGADSTIGSIAKNTRPLSQEGVRSKQPSQFVVEVPAGFTDAYGIAKGDKIQFDLN